MVCISPAHSLHHVCDEAVGDARTGLLGQVEGVFQLLNGSYAAATRPPLLLQLVVEKNQIKRMLYVVRSEASTKHYDCLKLNSNCAVYSL